MQILGIPLEEIDPMALWLVASILLLAIGYVGGRLFNMIVGADAIIDAEEGDPKFSSLRETILPAYTANKGFKRMVYRRASHTFLGNFFFYAFIGGLLSTICAGAFIAMTGT